MRHFFSRPIAICTAACGLLLGICIAPARAQTTIISVTGPEFPGLGIFPGQSVAFSFAVSQPYVDVTISARLSGSFTGTAFLMRQIGPETTSADEITRAAFVSAAHYPDVRSLVQPVLQHVTLPENGYYTVVLSTLETSVPQGLSTTTQPTLVTDVGVSNGPLFFSDSSSWNDYPPARSFQEIGWWFGLFEVTGIPSLIAVQIDVRPGTFPNSVNPTSSGIIPVAIFSTSAFDAPVEIDVTSLTLAGASVRMAGASGRALCIADDVNRDGLNDLRCSFENDLQIAPGDTTVVLRGRTFGGRTIYGEDSIQIVPD